MQVVTNPQHAAVLVAAGHSPKYIRRDLSRCVTEWIFPHDTVNDTLQRHCDDGLLLPTGCVVRLINATRAQAKLRAPLTPEFLLAVARGGMEAKKCE